MSDRDIRLLSIRFRLDMPLEPEDHSIRDLSYMIEHGEIEKAKQKAANFLRDGKSNREFLEFAADLLEGKSLPKAGKGRPKQDIYTTRNRRIMYDFNELRGLGFQANRSGKKIKYEDAIAALSDEYGMSERSIEAVVSYFANKRKLMWAEYGSIEDFRSRIDEENNVEATALRDKLPDKHYDHEIIDNYRIVQRAEKTDNDYFWAEAARRFVRSTCIHNCKSDCQKPNILKDRRLCKESYASEVKLLRAKNVIKGFCDEEGVTWAEFLSILEIG